MNKTILLGVKNSFPFRINQWLYLFIGIMFIGNGIYHIIENHLFPWGRILGLIMLLPGFYYTIYGITAFNKHSKYAPKVKLEPNQLILKQNLFSPSYKISWAAIQKIQFGTYQLNIFLNDDHIIFHYHSRPAVSLEIKKAIREAAEMNNISMEAG
ncbi:MAG: hypothetical protein ACNS62_00810 [Candidatus Cyclobacteriaceae bacterium M3_2C_046]